VQRAHAEARERAAAEAKERAEKAAAEARERANAEVREREARERAAVARAEADARLRAERAAVERAAAEARERAAAAARANQQKSENDLESFFSARATSAQRPRTNTLVRTKSFHSFTDLLWYQWVNFLNLYYRILSLTARTREGLNQLEGHLLGLRLA
jgi:hypothetical protein